MDRDLEKNPLSPKDLLATSPTYESELQDSPQNPFQISALFAQLGDLTRRYLQVLKRLPAPSLSQNAKQAQIANRLSLSKKTQPKEHHLLEVLKSLKQSGRSIRRSTAHVTTILKAPQK
jgi:hypothetical protein